jgi:hypothetical protein
MKSLNLEDFKMHGISDIELLEISGGHDGDAYEFGVGVGKFIKVVATLCAFAIFL